jgi:hypothetical protein
VTVYAWCGFEGNGVVKRVVCGGMYGDKYRRVVCGEVVNCNMCADVEPVWRYGSVCGSFAVVQECCGGGVEGCGVETLRCEVEAWDYLTKCIKHELYLVYLVAVTTL